MLYIPYYNNNVFYFCTHGVPEDCWVPVDPRLGTYVVTDGECFNSVSANLYAQVCPHGFEQSAGFAALRASKGYFDRISAS